MREHVTVVVPTQGQPMRCRTSYVMPAVASASVSAAGPGTIVHSIDVATPAENAFAFLCDVEKWPVWLSFLRSARRVDGQGPLAAGSEVALRSLIPGDEEQLFEVDRYVDCHMVSLVGAYSTRRRLEFRLEGKSKTAKFVLRVDYPSYGGALFRWYDQLTARRRLRAAVNESVVHFKGLVEFGHEDAQALLADF